MKITMLWGDGEYDFLLRLGEIRELQEKTGLGPYKLFERIRTHEWFIDDLRETIRLGLIGAGLDNAIALKLIKNNFDARQKLQQEIPALAILSAFLTGDKEDPVGKSKAEEGQNGQMGSSPSPQSMEQVA
jgi:hypothetical protein